MQAFRRHWAFIEGAFSAMFHTINQSVFADVCRFAGASARGDLTSLRLGTVPVVHLNIGVSFGDNSFWLGPLVEALRRDCSSFVATLPGSLALTTKGVFEAMMEQFGMFEPEKSCTAPTTATAPPARADAGYESSATRHPARPVSPYMPTPLSRTGSASSMVELLTSSSISSAASDASLPEGSSSSATRVLRSGRRVVASVTARTTGRTSSSGEESDIQRAIRESLQTADHERMLAAMRGGDTIEIVSDDEEGEDNIANQGNTSTRHSPRYLTRSTSRHNSGPHGRETTSNAKVDVRSSAGSGAVDVNLKFDKKYLNRASAMMLANDVREWYEDTVACVSQVLWPDGDAQGSAGAPFGDRGDPASPKQGSVRAAPLVLVFTEAEAIPDTLLQRFVRLLQVQMPSVPVVLIMVGNASRTS